MLLTNALAYEHTELFTNVKMFIVQAPGLLAAGSTSKSRQKPEYFLSFTNSKDLHNGRARIRDQCRKTTDLNCHRCLINTGVEKMNNIYIQIRTFATRCLYVRVNVGIQTIVYIFKVRCSIYLCPDQNSLACLEKYVGQTLK